MLELSYLQCRCHFILALVFMSTCPVEILTLTNSISHALLSVESSSSLALSGLSHSVLSLSADDSSSATASQTVQSLNLLVTSILDPSRIGEQSSWSLYNGSTGTVQLEKTISNERTSYERYDHGTTKSTLAHNQSLVVTGTPMVEQPSSSGIITSPIVSSKSRKSSLDNWQSRNTAVTSSFEVVSVLTKNEQSSRRKSLDTETTMISQRDVMSSTTLAQTGIYSKYISSSTLETSPGEQLGKTAARSNGSSNMSSLKMVHSSTIHHNNETPRSVSVSSYGHSTSDTSFSNTLIRKTVVTTRLSDFHTTVGKDGNSQTNNGTTPTAPSEALLIGFTSTSLKVQIISSIQPSISRRALSTQSAQLVPSPTLTATYNAYVSLVHATGPRQNSNIRQNSNKAKISESSLSQLILSYSLRETPMGNTVNVSQSHSLSSLYHSSNAYNVVTSSLSSIPFVSSTPLNSLKHNNASTKSTQPAMLGTSRTERVMNNSYLSSAKMNILPTFVVSKTTATKHNEYTLQTIESQKSYRVKKSTPGFVVNSTPLSEMSRTQAASRTHEASVVSDSVPPMVSQTSYSWPTASSLVHQSASPSLINATSPTRNKSSIAISKESSHVVIHRSVMSSGTVMSPSHHISDTFISSVVPIIPTASHSAVMSSSLLATSPSLMDSSHGVTSTAVHPDLSKMYLSKISLSKIVGYSVIPIIKPCYISYVITITQRHGLPSNSSAPSLHNISSSSLPSGTASYTELENRSTNFILHPSPSTTSTAPQFNTESLSISGDRIHTLKSAFPSQSHSETDVTSSDFHSLTKKSSRYTLEVAVSYNVSKNPSTSAVEATTQFSMATLSVIKKLSKTRPQHNTRYQSSLTTVEPAPSVNRSLSHSFAMKPSLEPLQTSGHLSTPVESYSHQLASSRFATNSNKITASASVFEVSSRDRTRHPRTIASSVTSSPTWTNLSSFIRKTSLIEDIVSTQSAMFVNLSTTGIQSTPSLLNASLPTAHRNEETSTSILPSIPKMSAVATNMTFLKTTRLPNQTRISSASIRDRSTAYANENSSPTSVSMVNFATPVLSNISASVPLQITLDGDTSTISSLPTVLVNSTLREPTMFSLSKSIERSSTPGTGTSISVHLASHNLSSSDVKNLQRSPVTTIYPTQTTAINRSTTSTSLWSETVALQSVPTNNSSPKSTESLSTLWIGKPTSVQLSSINFSSTELGISQRSLVTITISPSPAIDVNKSTINEPLQSSSPETVAPQSVSSQKSSGIDTTILEDYLRETTSTLLNLTLSTVSSSPYSGSITSRIPTDNSNYVNSNLSMSKMTIHPVDQTASMISSIDFTSSPEAFPDAKSIYHLSSSSANIQASQYHSNIISPSPSETTSPNTTAPTRRKRRAIQNAPQLLTNSNSSTVRDGLNARTIQPTKSPLLSSVVLATSTTIPRLSSTSQHHKSKVNSSEFLKPSSATVGGEDLSISLVMTHSLTKSPSVLTTVYPSKNVSPISRMLKNSSNVMSSKSNLQSSSDALQGIETASQTVSNSSGSYSTTFSKFDQAPSTITWYSVASSDNMLNNTAIVIQGVLVTSHTFSTSHILALTMDKSSPTVLQTTQTSTNSRASLETMANPSGSISTFSLHTFQSRVNTKDIPNATSLSFATQIPSKSSKTTMPIFSSLGVAVSSAVISPSYNPPSQTTISPYHFSSSEDSSDHLPNRTVISKSYLPISESDFLRNSSQTSPLSSTAHGNEPSSTNSITIITPVVVHTVKNSSIRESSTQTSFQVIATAHFSRDSQKVTRVSRSRTEERELKPTHSLSYVSSHVISQKRNSSQHTVRNPSIRESLTKTSFQVVATANFSTVSQKISTVSRSPADKKEIRPTLSSSYVSSTVISQNRNSSPTPSSSGKLLFSELTNHQTRVISLAIYSTARLSPSLPTATTSAAKTATTMTKRPTVPLFTYYLIPTSSLGSCLVGYSTIYLSNVSGELLTTTAATPRNTSAESPSPVLFTGTLQSSAINASMGSPSPIFFTGTPQSSTINASAGSPSPVVFTWTSSTSATVLPNRSSSFVVNITSRPIMSLQLNPSSSPTFQSESSVVDQMNNSTIVKPSLYSTQNVDASKGFYGSTTIHPRLRTSFSNTTVVASPTSYRASVSNIQTQSVQTAPRSVIATSSVSPNVKTSVFTIPVSPSLSSSYSSISPSSSVITTSPTSNETSLLLIVLSVPLKVNIRTNQFKEDMEEKLNDVYRKGQLVQKSRRKRNARLDTSVKVQNVRRDREKVNVEYVVIDNNKTMPAAEAAKTMNVLSVETLSSSIGYKVLVRPEPAPKEFTTDNIVAMLIETNSQNNISSSLVKKSFENELANFYINSGKGARVQNVSALVTYTYFEPLQRTYIEFAIIVDQATVNHSLVLQVFNVPKSELTSNLKQSVLVGPYIPGSINPTVQDYIIQGMEYNGGNSEEAKKQLSTKLSEVYLAAKQKGSRKRRKRALGSIDSVITNITPAKDSKVDVTYYIIDGGSILNATYASSILNRLSIKDMSSITTPYVVTTTPRSTLPSTSKMSEDDGYPSWMIPVIAASSVGFVLFIIIIILYCRWKKGAPSKKVQPQVTSATEEQREGPRITHAADPEVRRDLGRHPPPIPTAVSTEENNARSSLRPPVRKPPVRENSVRRKVCSRESLITSQMTRTNPAFVGESGDESDGVTVGSVAQNGRRQTKAQVVAKKEIVEPRKRPRSLALQETLESEEESETDASDGDSIYTKDSVFTGNTNQHSPAALPTLAVMSETRPPVQQPPVRFRTSVHPEASLPPIDVKQTSLIGRVVEEEGPLQQEISKKADIERWRNKQRQREKKLGESQSKPAKRSSFTEKKAWSRAQQEIGLVLDPDAMQPIVRKKKRKPRRKYNMMTETTDDENNVQLRGFQKLGSPREEKKAQREQDSQSDSDISMGEARRRMISLLDDAFASMKSSSKKHSADGTDQPDGKTDSKQRQGHPPSGYRPPLHPRPAVSAPALPEPPPAHGRATAPSARHRRRFLNSQNSLPYPSNYYPGSNGRAPYPPPQPVYTKNPVVVWDPADKQRLLNQSSYRPYPGHPYTYSDPSGRLHFTPVQHTPDGMGGLVWSPYATEYAMEDFYRNARMPETLDAQNATFLSEMQETPLAAVPEGMAVPRDTVIDMGGSGITSETGSMTGQSAEPLVRAIKDELFRLSNGRTPVKHL